MDENKKIVLAKLRETQTLSHKKDEDVERALMAELNAFLDNFRDVYLLSH